MSNQSLLYNKDYRRLLINLDKNLRFFRLRVCFGCNGVVDIEDGTAG